MTTNRTKIIVWATFISVVIIGGLLIYFDYRHKSRIEISSREAKVRVKTLETQNEILVESVKHLNGIVEGEKERDSLLKVLAENSQRTIPELDKKISSLNKNYESKISAARNYDASDAERYIAREAARIRSEQAQ